MMRQHLQAWSRLAWMLVGTTGLITGLLLRLAVQPKRRQYWQHRYRYAWGRWCCHALRIRVHQRGQQPAGPCLIVTNHHSWIDPPALMAACGCTLLSKAEVAQIPIVGWGAGLVGTLFVQREAVRSRAKAQAKLAATLRAGVQAAVFPEGTTSRPGALLPFHPGSFRLAAQLGLPVALAHLHFPQSKAIWIDEPIGLHYRQVVGTGPTDVHIQWGPVLDPGTNPDLRAAAVEWLTQADRDADSGNRHF